MGSIAAPRPGLARQGLLYLALGEPLDPLEGRRDLVELLRLALAALGGSELSHGRCLEEEVHGQLDLETLAEPCHQLGGEQGISAQLEEVVVGSDLVDAEEVLPDLGHRLFVVTGGRNVGRLQVGSWVE